jgi:hypothetical protein
MIGVDKSTSDGSRRLKNALPALGVALALHLVVEQLERGVHAPRLFAPRVEYSRWT